MKKSITLKSIILITVVCLALQVASCSSDKSELSVKEMLTSKSWVIKSKIIDPSINMNGFVISDIMILDSDEVRNYSFKFNTDGTFVLYDNLNKNIFETTWVLSSDETLITLTEPVQFTYPAVGNVGMKTITIESITSKSIVAKIPPFIYGGISYVATFTFI